MNPPFNQGARFALKAWDMLWSGEAVVILNAETIRNPFSEDRKRLVKLIEAHGSVSFERGAFEGPGVERQAEVEVALVYLNKPAGATREWITDVVNRLEKDGAPLGGPDGEFGLPNELALPASFIQNQCANFRRAVSSMREAVLANAAAAHFEMRIGQTMAQREAGAAAAGAAPDLGVPDAYRERYLRLKDRAWASILASTDALSRLSSAVHRQALSQFEQIKMLEFNEANVYGFLLGLIESRPDLLMDMCDEVFDLIGRYHSDNVVFYRGWKSNSKHRTAGMRLKGTRFILPGFAMEGHQHSLGHSKMQSLADIDKVFAMLDGKSTPEISLVEVFSKRLPELRSGERLSASYFDVRFHPGVGTIHFFPRGRELMDRLNRFVGQRRAWLPPAETTGAEAFWQSYEAAEKFDGKVRKGVDAALKRLVAAGGASHYQLRHDPLRCAMEADSDREEARLAAQMLTQSIDDVLAEAGLLALIEAEVSGHGLAAHGTSEGRPLNLIECADGAYATSAQAHTVEA